MNMPPNPVLAPQDKTQPEARAAAIAARTVPARATGVRWILRATRISTSAMPERISSGRSTAITARLLQPGVELRKHEDRRGRPPGRVRDTRLVWPGERAWLSPGR